MQSTLIVGCSYVSAVECNRLKIGRYGSPASANSSIASRVIYQLGQQTYNKVVILWSGINRLSLPVDNEIHAIYQQSYDPYRFFDQQGSTVWYHSGGILGMEYNTNAPKFVKNYFTEQYKTASSCYLTDQTLSNVIAIQSLLESKQIDYAMSFIYDIHKDYANDRFGYSLGNIDTSSRLYNLVNWNKIDQQISPYEWAKQNNQLDEDQFHITSTGLHKWFGEYLNIDLLA